MVQYSTWLTHELHKRNIAFSYDTLPNGFPEIKLSHLKRVWYIISKVLLQRLLPSLT